MSNPLRPSAFRQALAAAGLACAAASAGAVPNLTVPIGTCAPANLVSLQFDLRLTSGAVRRAGRNPPGGATRYLCDVPDDFSAAPPTWNRFEFQYIDRNLTGNGHAVARLMRRPNTSGSGIEVARLTSVPSTTLRTLAATLPALPARNDYYVIVDLVTTNPSVDAFAFRLLTR